MTEERIRDHERASAGGHQEASAGAPAKRAVISRRSHGYRGPVSESGSVYDDDALPFSSAQSGGLRGVGSRRNKMFRAPEPDVESRAESPGPPPLVESSGESGNERAEEPNSESDADSSDSEAATRLFSQLNERRRPSPDEIPESHQVNADTLTLGGNAHTLAATQGETSGGEASSSDSGLGAPGLNESSDGEQVIVSTSESEILGENFPLPAAFQETERKARKNRGHYGHLPAWVRRQKKKKDEQKLARKNEGLEDKLKKEDQLECIGSARQLTHPEFCNRPISPPPGLEFVLTETVSCLHHESHRRNAHTLASGSNAHTLAQTRVNADGETTSSSVVPSGIHEGHLGNAHTLALGSNAHTLASVPKETPSENSGSVTQAGWTCSRCRTMYPDNFALCRKCWLGRTCPSSLAVKSRAARGVRGGHSVYRE